MSSSEPSGATLIFPTGIDVYSQKIDQGVIISGESHAIPVGSPFEYHLAHVPLFQSPSVVSIPGYTETTGTPSSNEFRVTYSGNDAGQILHSSFNAGSATSVTYTTNGSLIVAEWTNSIQTSITGIETFIADGLGITGNFMPLTGGTFTGSITLNGASLLPAASGSNNVGLPSEPFNTINADVFTGKSIQSQSGQNQINFTNSINISGNSFVSLQSDGDIIASGLKNVNITAVESGVHITSLTAGVEIAGHTFPDGSFIFDLGTSSKRWRTIYADDLNLTNNGFVRRSGDDMFGDLTMSGNSSVNTAFLTSPKSSLAILAISGNISLTTSDDVVFASTNVILPGINSNVLGNTLFANTSPNASGTIDLGTPAYPYANVYADNINGITGNFVSKSGDDMFGDLNMNTAAINVATINGFPGSGDLNVNVNELNVNAQSNISFDVGPSGTNKFTIGLTSLYMSDDLNLTSSGLYDIGEMTRPLRAIYADKLNIGVIGSGVTLDDATFGDITVTGTLGMASGSIFNPLQSGTVSLGSTGAYFDIGYFNQIVTAEGTGTFLSRFGDTMVGTFAVGTGSGFAFDGSGVNDMGSPALPLGTLYADQIVSSGLDDQYVKKTGDEMSGPLTLSNIASTGSLFISGVTDIIVSGNQIYHNAEQLNYTSTTGPIIINANTELQLSADGIASLVVNTTGTEAFKDVFPDVSGTHSLGTPQRPWGNIYALNIVPVGTSGTGNFVLKIGDNMSGDLTFSSGIGIGLLESGTSDIGTISNPLNAIYADQIIGTNPSGQFVKLGGDTMTGNLFSSTNDWTIGTITGSGNTTVHSASGLTFRSSDSQNISMLSANGVTVTNSGNFTANNNATFFIANQFRTTTGGGQLNVQNNDIFIKGPSGEYLMLKNGTIALANGGSGSTNILTNNAGTQLHKNILPSGSGTISVGTQASPFENVYAQNINGVTGTFNIFNEVPAGLVNSSNTVYTTVNTPVSGTQRVYRAGLRMTPGGVDYDFSGSTITFVTAPTTGDNLLVDYKYPVY